MSFLHSLFQPSLSLCVKKALNMYMNNVKLQTITFNKHSTTEAHITLIIAEFRINAQFSNKNNFVEAVIRYLECPIFEFAKLTKTTWQKLQ